jgi:hypothetical protein
VAATKTARLTRGGPGTGCASIGPRHRKARISTHAEHANGDWAAAPPVTRCRQRVSVDIQCVIDGLGAARKHQRVPRASPYYICVGFLSIVRRHSHPTHPFPAGYRKFVARRSDLEGSHCRYCVLRRKKLAIARTAGPSATSQLSEGLLLGVPDEGLHRAGPDSDAPGLLDYWTDSTCTQLLL